MHTFKPAFMFIYDDIVEVRCGGEFMGTGRVVDCYGTSYRVRLTSWANGDKIPFSHAPLYTCFASELALVPEFIW